MMNLLFWHFLKSVILIKCQEKLDLVNLILNIANVQRHVLKSKINTSNTKKINSLMIATLCQQYLKNTMSNKKHCEDGLKIGQKIKVGCLSIRKIKVSVIEFLQISKRIV